jgi:hypothetical protein
MAGRERFYVERGNEQMDPSYTVSRSFINGKHSRTVIFNISRLPLNYQLARFQIKRKD